MKSARDVGANDEYAVLAAIKARLKAGYPGRVGGRLNDAKNDVAALLSIIARKDRESDAMLAGIGKITVTKEAFENSNQARREMADRLRGEIERRENAEASLATVTADRDAARSDLAEARVSIGKLRSCVTSRENDTYAAFHEGDAWQARAEKAEAALASSVRREDVALWIWEIWNDGKAADLINGCPSDGRCDLDASPCFSCWLRDLATMDGRPAETSANAWTCPKGCGVDLRLHRAGVDECPARPANKETDNG